ncbi:HAMP domain-containing histidine kinase [Thalassomonas viridans]|uniref:histidine kinase n=1 Tax=Thalassomonas viridans TaxID=137584 RepID=A0AAE9YZX4_9GAMM|nr:HAMP domain-containing sensor histidine kinase [Thalassomonas viridans]WDE04075.1 HAMP domain-containing histidine kinase [Thalassomonas viridans]
MTREFKLISGLALVCIIMLALLTALLYSLGWSHLGVSTLLFVVLYPLIWFCWRVWRFWRDPWMQLTSYTQMLKEGGSRQQLVRAGKDELFSELVAEIEALAGVKTRERQQLLTVEQLVSQMMDSWDVPVCLFNDNKSLLYSNNAANALIRQPVLRGKAAADMGFSWQKDGICHPAFAGGWEVNTIEYHQQGQSYWLFSAVNISSSLSQAEITSQKNIVRVLSHELRNSLTPMASMADTLLSSEPFSPGQVRMVLERILQRSQRLLAFIQQYARLNQLPPPSCNWFDFHLILDEARGMLPEAVKVNYLGEALCYGDAGQLSQLLINLLKNAFEARNEAGPGEKGDSLVIDVSLYHENNRQFLTVKDNGPGFANLDNVLTPFYTTKSGGSGIGLALCAQIARLHGGELSPANGENGAEIRISLPF